MGSKHQHGKHMSFGPRSGQPRQIPLNFGHGGCDIPPPHKGNPQAPKAPNPPQHPCPLGRATFLRKKPGGFNAKLNCQTKHRVPGEEDTGWRNTETQNGEEDRGPSNSGYPRQRGGSEGSHSRDGAGFDVRGECLMMKKKR